MTEFNDPFNVASTGKVWLKSHGSEVLSMCIKPPSTLVTTTGAGEIGIWWLETGQLIKMHTVRTKVRGGSAAKFSKSSVGSMAPSVGTLTTVGGSTFHGSSRRIRRERYAVVACHVLRARPEAQEVGTLITSVRNGTVQLWCTHKVGGRVYLKKKKKNIRGGDGRKKENDRISMDFTLRIAIFI